MEEDEDDDIYAPDEASSTVQNILETNGHAANKSPKTGKTGNVIEEDEEEGEEVEESESDSDIDIITERKGDSKPEPVQAIRISSLKAPPSVRPSSTEPGPATRSSPAVKTENSTKEVPQRPGSSYPAIKTSTIDVDAKPIYEPNGKPITDIDMDADFPEDDKPWRRPGTDMTDYFNYGFDEFTWATYCLKQKDQRKELADSKKAIDDMQSFLTSAPSLPGMPGPPGGASQGMPAMSGMGDIPPEMQQMMMQMMSQGMDPSQMDPNTMMQMMSGMQGGHGNEPGQGFGPQGFGQQGQNQQHMGYGYGGGGGRNQGGRGQNRRW